MGMVGMIGSMRSLGQDVSVLHQKVKAQTARRMRRFAVPYAGLLALFLVVVILEAAVSIANPLIYRNIINNCINRGDAALIIRLAVVAGILGIVDAALGL